ncbi:3-hydroxyisobutyrate dehydrogenase, mitochondrial [Leptopilina heterotoma]|uniref:3-hydroxyisobutyrate dehydrogenase, mitochondrial n=1 Tax=Leptopilina heterotoma TaxID=63436 RepID=UPI001CA98AED|nr:3-hydroxyisobutyrate dehydrogenase, mitochondrial [Leptopilina heterotoma]
MALSLSFRRFLYHSRGSREFSNVGFIGLGQMGSRMAKNILKKGHKLTVFDVNKFAVTKLCESGATSAESAAEVSQTSEIIITMLPSNKHVLDCYTGEKGILSFAKKNTLLIDSSTIDPSVSETVSQEAEKKNMRFIDGPVSGGVNAAENGTLTFMVGGLRNNFDDAKSIFEAMGSRIVHCGEKVGMGQAAKLCNNMLLAISMIGTAEAFNLGQKLGLDSKVLAEIVNSSSGRCWASEVYNPVPGLIPNVPSSNNYQGGFGTTLMAKDLGLAQDIASRSKTPILLGSLAHQIYLAVISKGFADKDFSVIYQFLKDDKKT